jgi:hypothetical protein
MQGSRSSALSCCGVVVSIAVVAAFACVLIGPAVASECNCPQPPGGGGTCQSDQVAYCTVRAGACHAKCTPLSMIIGQGSQDVRFLESIGVDGDTISAIDVSASSAIDKRIRGIEQVQGGRGERYELILSEGDRASVDGSRSGDLEGILGERRFNALMGRGD